MALQPPQPDAPQSLPDHLPQPTPGELSEGSQAIGEAAAMAAGLDMSDREKLNRVNDLFRTDRRESHFHRVTICGLWFAASMFALMFLVLVLHYILPDSKRFLTVEQVGHLQAFLFSGTLGGVLTGAVQKVIPNTVDKGAHKPN